MESSDMSSCDESQLATETMSFNETTFSVLPVTVEGQSISLGDLEQDPLEAESLLVPFPTIITLDNDSEPHEDTLLDDTLHNQASSLDDAKNDVVHFEERAVEVEAEVEMGVDWESEAVDSEEVSVPVTVTDAASSAVFEAHVLQLDGGTLAYIHAQPQEGCQAVELEDGTVAYITLAQPLAWEPSEELKVETDDPPKKQKSFMCPQEGCGRLYTSPHHLKVHERTHTGSRPYNCTVEGCKKAFSTDYSRKAHIRTHTGEKPYECPERLCSKSFKTSGDLQKHIRTHTGERPFVCPVPGCNRSFTTSNIRKVHIRTHTGERPYVCTHPYCDKAFASATNFKNHVRIHSGEKPYVCNVAGCTKRFTEYSSLYKHHIVHTQERAYMCNVCGRRYRQASTLTVHKRTSHGVIEADDGTELVLGDMFSQKVIKTANILTKNNKLKTVKTMAASLLKDGDYILDSEGSIQRISSEQIFIIEDVPEHMKALRHIQGPDEGVELGVTLDPLQEQ